jgi:YidC/Oxa1 family membrane protein insertase
MEERRLLLAVALSLLALTAYQLLHQVLFPAPPVRRPSPAPVAAGPATADAPAASPVAPPTPGTPAPAPTPAPVATVADERERRVEVHGADFVVAFTNRGARLLSWTLTGFRDPRGRPEEMVLTVPGQAHPLDLETGDAALDARLRDALFLPSAETLDVRRDGPKLEFRHAGGDLEVTKRLRFDGSLVRVEASVRQGGREVPLRLVWGPGLGNPSAEERAVQGYHDPQAVYREPDGDIERVPAKDIGAVRSVPAAQWVGVETQYFAALLVPPGGPAPAELRATQVGPESDRRQVPVVLAPVGAGPALVYVGPKDHSRLSALGHDLAKVVPVGDWIGPIVIPLLKLLRFVHARVGNYGWSIVLLTVVINLVMAPLRHYSIANGMKMAKLAPEIRAIQARYRGIRPMDPKYQEMQKELGALYGRHGMNMGTQMAVGCVPILITMPFLIAFYRVLTVAVELRGAPFVWIPDLSHRDPFFITPVLMAASMFVTQKLTPTGMDPAQQRIMMIMPIVFGVMFFAAPAGLNLYWLASNVCSIVQQVVTMQILKRQEASASGRERRR